MRPFAAVANWQDRNSCGFRKRLAR
jgi:hypothetical protein